MITGPGWISAGPGYRHHLLGGRALIMASSAVSWRFYKMAIPHRRICGSGALARTGADRTRDGRIDRSLRPPQPVATVAQRSVYAGAFIGRSWMIIQLMPNRSRNWPNLVAKNVSCIGMNTSPPSERAEKMRSASASLSTPKDR